MTEESLSPSSRQTVVDELSAFIDTSHGQLDALLAELKWTKKDLTVLAEKDKEMMTCPVNPDHRVPASSLEKHAHQCRLVARGCSREEQKDIKESHRFFYENSSSVVQVLLDEESQREILSSVPGFSGDWSKMDIPLTSDRMDEVTTSAQKLALHQAVLERSKVARKQADAGSLQELECDPDALLKTEAPDKPKSRLEILAELRDYKRRRQSYRAKNVHITRRTQTEIMREIIEAQMNEIQQAAQGKDGSAEEAPDDRGRSPSPGRSDRPGGRDVDRRDGHLSSAREGGSSHQAGRSSARRSRSDADGAAGPDPGHRSRDSASSAHDSSQRDRSRSAPDRGEIPRVKTEGGDHSRRRDAGDSSGPLIPHDGESRRGATTTGSEEAAVRIKAEDGEDSGSRSSSQSRGAEDGESRSHRSKRSKHHHKHHHHRHRRHHDKHGRRRDPDDE